MKAFKEQRGKLETAFELYEQHLEKCSGEEASILARVKFLSIIMHKLFELAVEVSAELKKNTMHY